MKLEQEIENRLEIMYDFSNSNTIGEWKTAIQIMNEIGFYGKDQRITRIITKTLRKKLIYYWLHEKISNGYRMFRMRKNQE